MIALTIVTISFDDPVGLQRTLQSLSPLQHSELSWEHVIVDSSPEVNRSALSELPREWPTVHLTTPPEGIYTALNTGLAAARGDLIWFLNGGDRLRDVDTLRTLVAHLQTSSGVDMICAAADFTADGAFLYSHFPRSTLLSSLLGRNRVCQQAVLYRRSVFSRVGAFDVRYRIAGDYDHHFRCYLAGLHADCRPDRLVEYDLRGASSNWRRTMSEFRQVLQELRDELPASVYRRAVVLSYLEMLRLRLVKWTAASALGETLRPAWLLWNRALGRAWSGKL